MRADVFVLKQISDKLLRQISVLTLQKCTRMCMNHHTCRVEMVIFGAEAVVESGGVVNKLGSYQVCAFVCFECVCVF